MCITIDYKCYRCGEEVELCEDVYCEECSEIKALEEDEGGNNDKERNS